MGVREKYIALLVIIAYLAMGCTKPYNPKAITGAPSYLVVEGTINTGGDSTTILLSRTLPLNSASSTAPITGATIIIQDDQNNSYSLIDKGTGAYVSAILNLDNTRKYRLNILTTDGKDYVSDYVSSIVTPPIDSVGFNIISNPQQGTGVQIYLNTHDPNNNTHYYHWDYDETWEFHSEYESLYVSNGDTILPRTPAQQVYQCWGSNISTDINLGSTAKLTQDVVYQTPITFIMQTAEKLGIRYSILVKQYALSSDAYNYFSILKQNTENLGSIFDAQPSQLTGNIHCTTNATLPVIGYISAGTVQQKRIYINNSQLPKTWLMPYPYSCRLDTSLFFRDYTNEVAEFLLPIPSPYVPIIPITVSISNPRILGYKDVATDCGDCSIRGSTVEPSFWQN